MNKNNYLFNYLIETNGNMKENNYLINYYLIFNSCWLIKGLPKVKLYLDLSLALVLVHSLFSTEETI